MSKFPFDQDKAIQYFGDTLEYTEPYEEFKRKEDELKELFKDYVVVFEDRVGSDKDQYLTVFKHKEQETLYGFYGYYSSYDGVNYDDPEIFIMEAVPTIEYRPAK